MKYDYVILDTETTGLNTKLDEILQLSIIDQDGNVLFDEYFKPSAQSWPEAMHINHITPDMVKDKKPISAYFNEIQDILFNADLLVGYNITFDLAMLIREGVAIPKTKIFDVMREFAPIYGEYDEYHGDYRWQKLTTAARFYKYDWQSHPGIAHNSLADCYATQHVYLSMLPAYKERVDENTKKIDAWNKKVEEENSSFRTKMVFVVASLILLVLVLLHSCIH